MEQQSRVFRKMCQQNSIDLVEQMLAAGMAIDTPQDDGCTGLWLAAEAGAVDAIKLLCENRANVNAAKTQGNVSALYVASQNGHVGAVDVLLLNGANPNVAKTSGATPLFIAAQQGFHAIVTGLLRAGANYSTPNAQGISPLMISSYQGHVPTVRALLQAGADPYATGQGKNALEWAEANGHRQTIQAAVEGHLKEVESQVERANNLHYGPSTTSSSTAQPAVAQVSAPVAASSVPVNSASVAPEHQQQQPISPYRGGAAQSPSQSWYEPQFLNRSGSRAQPAGSHERSFDTRSFAMPDASQMQRSLSRMNRSGSAAGGRSLSDAGRRDHSVSGFHAGGLTADAIAEENRRQQYFSHTLAREREKEGGYGENTLPDFSGSGTTPQQVYAVDQEWHAHKERLRRASHSLAETATDVQDAWMYSLAATSNYAMQMQSVKKKILETERRNEEQIQQSKSNVDDKGFAYPALQGERIDALSQFMQRGTGAKGPPPPLPPEEEAPEEPEVDPYAVQDQITLGAGSGQSAVLAPLDRPSSPPADDSEIGSPSSPGRRDRSSRRKKK